jgi:ABC-type branched-subunit amino acid transport system ATPase component
VNVISGFYPASGGDFFFDGKQITTLGPVFISRAGVARTFQNLKLFEKMTVLDNVLVGYDQHSRYNLADAILHFPRYLHQEREAEQYAEKQLDFVGLLKKKDMPAKDLPYGERRLLEIARALASKPRLLLLDEPVAGMNEAEKDHVMELIRNIQRKGITIILVEHSMRVIMNVCRKITVLDHGAKLAEGTPQEIQGNAAVIEAYLGREENDATPA